MVKYILKTKITYIFYEILQNAILGNNYVPLWNASLHCIMVLNSLSKLYIVFFPSNNTPDTLKLLFLLQNIFLNLVISKNSARCVIWRKRYQIVSSFSQHLCSLFLEDACHLLSLFRSFNHSANLLCSFLRP